MKKKSTRKTPPVVEPAQIDALQRLARVGKTGEALDRLGALQAKHPDFKPLYSLAYQIASMTDHPHERVARAWEWTRASPNSPMAWQALHEDAPRVGCYALAIQAGARLHALSNKPVAPPVDIDTPLGLLRFEEGVANDVARVLMAVGRFGQALAVLEGYDNVMLLNNAAMSCFHVGDTAGALQRFETSWQRHPRNIFALEHVVRLTLWTRGRDALGGLTASVGTGVPARAEDALGKIAALVMLGDWSAADAAWRACAPAAYWSDPGKHELSGRFNLAGGIAALRLGNLSAMRERFAAAAADLPVQRQRLDQIERHARDPGLNEAVDIELYPATDWFATSWIHRLKTIVKHDKSVEAQYDAHMMACDAHADYLSMVASLGGETGRFLAISILKLRAKAGDAVAKRHLVELLTSPCGPDSVRSTLHRDLVEAGLLPAGGLVPLLLRGEVREIRHLTVQIHAEQSPLDLPEESVARVDQVFALVAQREYTACVDILVDLIAYHPDVPLLYNNLASIKEALGHPDTAIEALLKQALTVDPDYLFAKAGLARIEARRGNVESATAMLQPLLEQERYHYTEWRSILLTQREIAKQQGDGVVARESDKQLKMLQQRFG